MSAGRRARAIAFAVLGLIALQLLLWLGYRRLSASRDGSRLPEGARVELAGGTVAPLAEVAGQGPLLLHFWATWCEPCRDELPTLLAFADAPSGPGELGIVLVSLDSDFGPVRDYFGGNVPARVVRDLDGRLAAALSVSTLPDTHLFASSGERLARYRGARDWRSPALRRELARALSSKR